MGPLFFLAFLLVPFTLNGFAVREAFFVSFLGERRGCGRLCVRRRLSLLSRSTALALAAPGGAILLWEGVRGSGKPVPGSR